MRVHKSVLWVRGLRAFLGEDTGSVSSPPKKLLNYSLCPSFCPLGWHTAETLAPRVADSFLTHAHMHARTHTLEDLCSLKVFFFQPLKKRKKACRLCGAIVSSLCFLVVHFLPLFVFNLFCEVHSASTFPTFISILGLLSRVLTCPIFSDWFTTICRCNVCITVTLMLLFWGVVAKASLSARIRQLCGKTSV